MTDISLRKKFALRRQGKRELWKSFTLPALLALLGICLRLFFDYQPINALTNWLQASWLLFTNQQALEAWISNHPTIQWLIGWVASPTVLFVLGWAIAKLPPTKWFIDRIFPDPPTFVFADLNAEREATMMRLDRSTIPLIGRKEELAGLTRLFDKDAAASTFRWQMLSGPSGIGKTRLAIEWLQNAKATGWDYGIIDPDDSELLRGWRARRPTALVIDEARSAWSGELEKAISRLQSGSGKGRPVRVLVIAQIAPYAGGAAPEEIKDSEMIPAVTLAPLVDEYLAELAQALDADSERAGIIVHESGGRPRAAIILANAKDSNDLASAMAAWAFRIVPELRSDEGIVDESLALGIIASGLAGPFPTAQLQGIASSFSVLPLLRLFPSVRQDAVEETLPALLPEDLGHELALRLLPRLGSAMRAAVTRLLIGQDPGQMEASLGNIWRDHPSYFDGTGEHGKTCAAAVTLRTVQDVFDDSWPDRVEQARQSARELVDLTSNHDIKRDELEQHLSHQTTLAASRPFDIEIRRAEATGACNAIYRLRKAEDFDALERWGAHLNALAEHPDFKNDADIRLSEAIGALNATSTYSDTKEFVALERWGARVITLAEHPDFTNHAAIRLEATKAAFNAILCYGEAQKFEDLERWGSRLIALTEHPNFTNYAGIRLQVALAATNAIGYYGRAENFVVLEQWGARLIGLSEHPDFSTHASIRLSEAKGTVNAILNYGKVGDFVALEGWGARLIALAEHPDLTNCADIRLEEATGAFNAITCYGDAQDFEGLERWGARLIALAEHPEFRNHIAIRLQESNGAMNAITFYGGANDFVALERWGARLVSLAEHPVCASEADIRLAVVKGVFNAINIYSKGKDFNALDRWGALLIVLAEHADFKLQAEMRLQEASGANSMLIAIRDDGRAGSGKYNSWQTRLAKVALDFPYHGAIQLIARDWGLDYMEQRSRGWPYGKGQ
jgi:hypothetical protein